MITDTLLKGACLVLGAALVALGAYHVFETGLLKADIQSKAAAITSLAKEKAALAATNAALKTANDNFSGLVAEQNRSIENLKHERDDADERARAAQKKAATDSRVYQKRIADILAAQPAAGQSWWEAWQRLVDGYYVDRGQAK